LGRLKPLGFREIKRRLESAGFEEVSQKGSHVKFARTSRERTDTVIVPRHHEVPVGTLRSILSQAHIDSDSWEKL
jgi:predicted RNA binding protein YcfA (HicA-like mRNA interferase family)